MSTPYYLTALGLCCALGDSKEAVWANAVNGSRAGMQPRQGFLPDDKTIVVGEVSSVLPDSSGWPAPFRTRNNQLAALAFAQIAPEVAALRQHYGASRIAVVLGSSTSGIAEGEQALIEHQAGNGFAESFHYQMQEMLAPAEFISYLAGVTGPAYCLSTACSSSARALLSAASLLQAGLADAVITGGVDSLCRLTLQGFSALEAVSSGWCQPFSANRDGINIGEAAALFVMQKSANGIALLGGGSSSDAHHMSAPHPEGLGAIAAIRQACTNAGIAPEQLDYINLHGTATALNDSMESAAIAALGLQGTAASSTKSLTGHTLGAAGALEAALCWLTLSDYNQQYYLLPHSWDGEADPALPVLNLVQPGQTKPVKYCLSNSFAFGGNNVALILGNTA